jgi:glycosyltransferase involved in cell wall biosynthesis
MKILQLVQKPQRRGAEVFAYQLSQEFLKLGAQVRIAYLYPHDRSGSLPVGQSDAVLKGKIDSWLEKFPGFHPGLLNRLNKMIQEFHPDIIQANGARTVKYGAFSRKGGAKLIYRNIGNPEDWVRDKSRRMFYQYIVIPRMDGIVGVSQTTLNRLLQFYKISVPVIQIPRGVRIEKVTSEEGNQFRQKNQTPPDAIVLLYIGSLSVEKRPDRFLRIVGEVRATFQNTYGWIVGEGPLREELEQQVGKRGLREAIRFFGVQDQLGPLLQASDLLLLTSDTEGIPGVILEAGSIGLPVVATAVGGVPECVLDSQTGILVDRLNENAFVAKVLELLKNRKRLEAMGDCAMDWVKQNFDIQGIAGRYMSFYEQVLQK